MKLTKLQRHTAYIIMLAESNKLGYGFCWMMLKLFYLTPSEIIIKRYFPELYRKRPPGGGRFWFTVNRAGWQKRIKLLKQCIEETY